MIRPTACILSMVIAKLWPQWSRSVALTGSHIKNRNVKYKLIHRKLNISCGEGRRVKLKQILLLLRPHLLLVFAQLSPHLAGFLGYLCDGDARVLRLDPLAAGVEPQHVGTHWPLGAAGIFLLLLLEMKKRLTGECTSYTGLYTLCICLQSFWRKKKSLSCFLRVPTALSPLCVVSSLFSPSPLWLSWPSSSLRYHLRYRPLRRCCRLLRHCCRTWLTAVEEKEKKKRYIQLGNI